MKKFYLPILPILMIAVLLSASSCRKNLDVKPEPAVTLETGKFDPSFGWNTARNLEINISSVKDVVINITSSDNLTRYHRGMHLGKNKTYTIKLSLPTVVNQLNINNKTLEITSNVINYDLK